MDDNLYWLQLGNSLTTLALAFLVLYLNQYFSKRAEAKVTLETTGEITKIQEAIKKEFQTQIAQLNLENQHRDRLSAQRLDAIFAYSDALHQMINISLNKMYDNALLNEKKYLEQLFAQFTTINTQHKLSRERLKLFFKDERFFEEVEIKVFESVLNVQTLTVAYFKEVHRINAEQDDFVLSNPSAQFEDVLPVYDARRTSAYNATAKSIEPLNIRIGTLVNQLKPKLSDFLVSIYK